MKLNEVSPSRFAELFVSALRDGITEEATDGYKTKDGYYLFIEPKSNKLEALYRNHLIIRMTFYKDNRTWDEAHFGRDGNNWEIQESLAAILYLYQMVQEEKGEHIVRELK